MKSRSIVIAALVLLGAVAVLALTLRGPDAANASSAAMVVYKSPTCGCCGSWIEHMKEAGFAVEAIDLDDVQPVKSQHKVGRALQSCHTALVDGYVVEGHVPAEFVVRMLAERPAIKGLAVPGMPLGSPGMEVADRSQWEDYDVIAFDAAGRTSVYGHVTANP